MGQSGKNQKYEVYTFNVSDKASPCIYKNRIMWCYNLNGNAYITWEHLNNENVEMVMEK